MQLHEINVSEFKVSPQTKLIAKQLAVVVGVTLLATTAHSAGFSLDDSGQKADALLKNIIKWAVILAGSAGTLVLLYKFIEAWNGRLDWMDFIKFAVFFACAGGVVTIAATIFGAFQ